MVARSIGAAASAAWASARSPQGTTSAPGSWACSTSPTSLRTRREPSTTMIRGAEPSRWRMSVGAATQVSVGRVWRRKWPVTAPAPSQPSTVAPATTASAWRGVKPLSAKLLP